MQVSDVQEIVTTFLDTSPLNRVAGWGGIPIYEDPLIGIAAADDRMFGLLKEETAVGPQHCSPQE